LRQDREGLHAVFAQAKCGARDEAATLLRGAESKPRRIGRVGWRQPGLTRQENRDAEICFATPAFAAEYYVAQNNSTHKCSIVSKKPDGKTLTMLGTEGFKTKSAAESALKGMAECKA